MLARDPWCCPKLIHHMSDTINRVPGYTNSKNKPFKIPRQHAPQKVRITVKISTFPSFESFDELKSKINVILVWQEY